MLTSAYADVAKRAAQVMKPAIVLDIHETSLSNSSVEFAHDTSWLRNIPCKPTSDTPCGSNNWVAMVRANPIEGTLALLRIAEAHHATVFFITGAMRMGAPRQ